MSDEGEEEYVEPVLKPLPDDDLLPVLTVTSLRHDKNYKMPVYAKSVLAELQDEWRCIEDHGPTSVCPHFYSVHSSVVETENVLHSQKTDCTPTKEEGEIGPKEVKAKLNAKEKQPIGPKEVFGATTQIASQIQQINISDVNKVEIVDGVKVRVDIEDKKFKSTNVNPKKQGGPTEVSTTTLCPKVEQNASNVKTETVNNGQAKTKKASTNVNQKREGRSTEVSITAQISTNSQLGQNASTVKTGRVSNVKIQAGNDEQRFSTKIVNVNLAKLEQRITEEVSATTKIAANQQLTEKHTKIETINDVKVMSKEVVTELPITVKTVNTNLAPKEVSAMTQDTKLSQKIEQDASNIKIEIVNVDQKKTEQKTGPKEVSTTSRRVTYQQWDQNVLKQNIKNDLKVGTEIRSRQVPVVMTVTTTPRSTGDDVPPEEPVLNELPAPEPELQGPSEKKTKIQVRPGMNVCQMDQGIYTSLPIVTARPKPYMPILYTFRAANWKMAEYGPMRTQIPPFYLQLDHTIAVLWTLFSPSGNKKKLGINQLQWALNFLKTLRNKSGSYPKDMDLAIKTIEGSIIDLYADLFDKLGNVSKMKEFVPPEEPPPFSVNYSEMIMKCPKCHDKPRLGEEFGLPDPEEMSPELLICSLNELKEEKLRELNTIDEMIANWAIQTEAPAGGETEEIEQEQPPPEEDAGEPPAEEEG